MVAAGPAPTFHRISRARIALRWTLDHRLLNETVHDAARFQQEILDRPSGRLMERATAPMEHRRRCER